MPLTDKDFQADYDAHDLIRAAEIQSDPTRFAAAMKKMKKMEAENRKRSKVIEIAKKLKEI